MNAAKAINAFVEAITYYISEGATVHISNFGTFEVRKRQPEYHEYLAKNFSR
ncbi:HU family DNA-binding protein [Lactococcus cremoris]|uniref:HU family DNA-binding protein n=1 Tax=Lactococcus lactis subsp. cremoris TaxID=1359 RepID=UPI00290735BB|nr:HU family DNA-binding protein [Lactococcus cremoris]MDU8932700.1 Integration host factor subunit alpha [Lactococcus cremoris]